MAVDLEAEVNKALNAVNTAKTHRPVQAGLPLPSAFRQEVVQYAT